MKLIGFGCGLVAALGIGYFAGTFVKLRESGASNGPQPAQMTDEKANSKSIALSKVPLAELIARQLESGELGCPNPDLITYEACLLYQGALGVWANLTRPKICPKLSDAEAPLGLAKQIELKPGDLTRAVESPCFAYLYAVQVANATPVLISTANRVFKMASQEKFPEPGNNGISCLLERNGICGNHAAVGLALLERAGFTARTVEFYYPYRGQRLTHIATEVNIEGAWRFLDTTYGAYWISKTPGVPFALISLDELMKSRDRAKNARLVKNEALLPYSVYTAVGHPDFFSYLNPVADVVRGGVGFIKLYLSGNNGIEKFQNLPNFIGDNRSDGAFSGVSFRIVASSGLYHLKVKVSAVASVSNIPFSLCVDSTCLEASKGKDDYDFLVRNPKQLQIKTDLDVAYVILKEMEWVKK